jgi:hypothetical protein
MDKRIADSPTDGFGFICMDILVTSPEESTLVTRQEGVHAVHLVRARHDVNLRVRRPLAIDPAAAPIAAAPAVAIPGVK